MLDVQQAYEVMSVLNSEMHRKNPKFCEDHGGPCSVEATDTAIAICFLGENLFDDNGNGVNDTLLRGRPDLQRELEGCDLADGDPVPVMVKYLRVVINDLLDDLNRLRLDPQMEVER